MLEFLKVVINLKKNTTVPDLKVQTIVYFDILSLSQSCPITRMHTQRKGLGVRTTYDVASFGE